MVRKRDGLVPVGEASGDLDGSVDDPRHLAPGAAPLHPGRSGEPACRSQRSRPRSGIRGADDGAVLPHPHGPLGDIFILDCPGNDKWLEVVFRSTCRL